MKISLIINLFLAAFSLLSMSLYPIDQMRDSSPQIETFSKTVSVCLKNGACYTLSICGVEKELQNNPKKFGGIMGDEKAMVISGFSPSANGKSITIKTNTTLRLTKRGKTSPSFQSRSVVAGKYRIENGKTTLKLK